MTDEPETIDEALLELFKEIRLILITLLLLPFRIIKVLFTPSKAWKPQPRVTQQYRDIHKKKIS